MTLSPLNISTLNKGHTNFSVLFIAGGIVYCWQIKLNLTYTYMFNVILKNWLNLTDPFKLPKRDTVCMRKSTGPL